MASLQWILPALLLLLSSSLVFAQQSPVCHETGCAAVPGTIVAGPVSGPDGYTCSYSPDGAVYSCVYNSYPPYQTFPGSDPRCPSNSNGDDPGDCPAARGMTVASGPTYSDQGYYCYYADAPFTCLYSADQSYGGDASNSANCPSNLEESCTNRRRRAPERPYPPAPAAVPQAMKAWDAAAKKRKATKRARGVEVQ